MAKVHSLSAFLKAATLLVGLLTFGEAHANSEEHHVVTKENFWTLFKSVSNSPQISGYIKFSIILDRQGEFSRTVFHPQSFPFHADHLATLADFEGLSPEQIDRLALYNEGRKVLLGTIIFPKDKFSYEAPWAWDIQLMSHDILNVEKVKQVLDHLSASHSLMRIRYSPVMEQKAFASNNISAFDDANILVNLGEPISKSICYANGWGVGRVLKISKDDFENEMLAGRIGTEDVLVLEEVPRDMPIVAGIIVSQTSSPSSHPALLAQMLGVPFLYEPHAFEKSSWQELYESGETIFIKSKGSTNGNCEVLVRKLNSLDDNARKVLRSLKRPKPLALDRYHPDLRLAIDLDKLNRNDGLLVGAKAANLGEMYRLLPGATVSKGMAIPIAVFHRYLDEATYKGQNLRDALAPYYKIILSDASTTSQILEALDKIRRSITKSDMPKELESEILSEFDARWPKGTRLKLRSSSNAEDNPNFNGAGLYDSKGVCLGDRDVDISICDGEKPDPVIKDLKKVWASLYTNKGFIARSYFGISEDAVGMGVLVHPTFKNEIANGVAISKMKKFGDKFKFELLITGFPGEDDSVANPPAGKVPETTLISLNWDDSLQIKALVQSTEVPAGRRLLSTDQYHQAYAMAEKVHRHYETLISTDPTHLALDFEWKLMPSEKGPILIFKQVRPVPTGLGQGSHEDKGSFLIGEKGMRLCPLPSEDPNALARIMLSQEVNLDMDFHEVPLTNEQIANPVDRLWTSDLNIDRELAEKYALVSFDNWRDSWPKGFQTRSFEVKSLANANNSYLRWTGIQVKPAGDLNELVDRVNSFATSKIYLGNKFGEIPLGVIDSDNACETEAVQGEQKGLVRENQIEGFRKPYFIRKKFSGDQIAVMVEGKTSMGIRYRDGQPGFAIDKTQFIHNTKTVISGLTDQDITISANLRSIFATGHHGFQWQYAFDLAAADNLSLEQQEYLAMKNIRYLVFPETLGNSFSDDPEMAIAFYTGDGEKVGNLGSLRKESVEVKCEGTSDYVIGIGCDLLPVQ